MKFFLSLICYAVGDLISLTTMRLGIGYSVYNKLMLWSSDLDDHGIIWKNVK